MDFAIRGRGMDCIQSALGTQGQLYVYYIKIYIYARNKNMTKRHENRESDT